MNNLPLTPERIVTLRRMIEWRWLIEQMALAPKDRPDALWGTIGHANLNMNIVTSGVADDGGDDPHFCVSACCALGAATLYPPFMAQGLRPHISDFGGLSSYKLMLDGGEHRYDDPELADWFGIGEEHYLRITDPASYRDVSDHGGPNDEESSIAPYEVIARMDAAIINAYGFDAVLLTPADLNGEGSAS